MRLSPDTLQVLVCPQCKGEVEPDVNEETEEVICRTCRLAYPTYKEIPIMLIDRAHIWTPQQVAQLDTV